MSEKQRDDDETYPPADGCGLPQSEQNLRPLIWVPQKSHALDTVEEGKKESFVRPTQRNETQKEAVLGAARCG